MIKLRRFENKIWSFVLNIVLYWCPKSFGLEKKNIFKLRGITNDEKCFRNFVQSSLKSYPFWVTLYNINKPVSISGPACVFQPLDIFNWTVSVISRYPP